MRRGWLWALLLTASLVLATSGGAWAHVEVSPEEVSANNYERLAVSVPTEKDIPTTHVKVEVPEGFEVAGVQPVPGWQHEFEEDGGIIRAITWSGGEIQPQEFQEFVFQARTPEDAGQYAWRALQTYEDGSVVEWTGPEDAEEPASVVEVVEGGTQGDEPGAAARETGVGFTRIAAYGGLVLGALALVVALLALLLVRRNKPS